MTARDIEFKVLIFMGTQAGLQIAGRLEEYTEHLYAVVASEYGYQEHPMGNLTLITNYLDDAGMQRWMDRVNFDLIVDAVSADRPEISEDIRRAAERNGIDYLKVIDKLNVISGVTITGSEQEFTDKIESSLGNILADGEVVYRIAADAFRGNGKKTDHLYAIVSPDEEKLRSLKECGCPESNIFCFGSWPSSEFISVFFNEYNMEFFLMNGSDRSNMVSKFEAIDRSNVKAIILGNPFPNEGLTADKAMRYIRKTYGLSRS